MTVHYRSYAPGDEAQILALYQAAFDITLSIEEWRWHYGRDAIIELAETDGRIIGHYAVQPRPFFVGDRACSAGLVLGSMVAPEHRNVSTFIELARQAYARCRERAIPFVYAFPNDNVWLVRRRMLDWHALPAITALGAAPASTRETDGVERTDVPPEAPWLGRPFRDRIRSSDPPAFVQWRLRERPLASYPIYVHRESGELRGYIALKRYRELGHVVAFRTAPGAELSSGRRLLTRALGHFAAENAERVTTWLLPGSPLYTVATAIGFTPEPGRGKNFGYLPLEDVPALGDAIRWDIGMADSDVF